MFDVVIAGGKVVDGSGSPGFYADVGVTAERIAAIGDLSRSQARRVIDAAGLTVCPGFIDTHTHSEGDLLIDPQHANGLRQGITTEVLGLDGMSYAPLSNENYRTYRWWLGGLLGDPPEDLDMSSVAAFRANYDRKVAINTAYLVPNGTVRLESVGFRDVPLTGDGLERAKKLLAEGFKQGAVGFSTGGSYYPGPWANTDELVELCKVVADAGAVYVCEPRRANLDRAFQGNGVADALEIARRTGVKLHFAHYRTSADTAGQTESLVGSIDRAKSEGVDSTFDIYPYPTGSSVPVSLLPSYVHEGGPAEIMRRLADPGERGRMVEHMEAGSEMPMGLGDAVLCYVPSNSHLEGMSLVDIAEERGTSPASALCDLLLEEDLKLGYLGAPPHSVAQWRQVSRDSLELLSRPDYMVCSDITPAGSMCHPRSFGAFPRFLGRLRRQFDVISLETMVQRMTDNPARRFGLTKRGLVAKEFYADLVVFDAERVIDRATYDDPRQYPGGIPYVLVNGQVAVDQERCTGVMAGRAVP